MPDDSFLSQLEQRTEQVKITLANLEAERARIENMIGQLQPIVPHYDALLAAERALRDSNLELHQPEPEPGAASLRPQEAEVTDGGQYGAESAPDSPIEAGIPPEYQGDPPPEEPWNS